MFIRDVAEALEKSGAPYCLVGGVAVALHGVPRLTFDVDVVVVPEVKALTAADLALQALGLRPRLPVRLVDAADETTRRSWLEDRNLIALTFTDPNDPLREVDVLINPLVDATQMVARSERLNSGGVSIRVACVDDLIAMKQAAGRPKDLADIKHLQRLKNSP
jgi:hypothetical protein